VGDTVEYLRELESNHWSALDIYGSRISVVEGSFDIPDVVIPPGDAIGEVGGSITVSNSGAESVPVRAYAVIYPGARPELGSLETPIMLSASPTVALAPGEEAALPLSTMRLLGSSQLDAAEYHAFAYVDVGAAIDSRLMGPYFDRFEVDSDDILDQIGDFFRDLWRNAVGEGESWTVEHIVPSSASRCYITLNFPGSDLDLHVYDSEGRHVGLNYETGGVELGVPGAEYSGASGVLEFIYLPASAGERYTIQVKGIETTGDEPFVVLATDVVQDSPVLSVSPAALQLTVCGRDRLAEASLRACEIGTSQPYQGLAAASTDLVGASGTIPAANVQLSVPTQTVEPGGSVPVTATITVPPDAAPGTYAGTFQIGPVDVPVALEIVNEPPTVSLANAVGTLPEDTDTSASVKVADIVVRDDGLGTNVLSLSGPDAALFEIVGDELFLRAGTVLDHSANPTLEVAVEVDDPTVGDSPDDQVELSITVAWPVRPGPRYQFTDADGDRVSVHLAGPGTMTLLFPNDPSKTGCDLAGIELDDTTNRSTLSIVVRETGTERGDGTTVADVRVHGSLSGLSARTTDLLGDLAATGTIRRIYLDDVADGHNITIGPADRPTDTVTLRFDQVADLVIDSETPIRSLVASDWRDSDATPDGVEAPWLGSLYIRGSRRDGLSGDFTADLALDGVGARRYTLTSARIAGALRSAEWTFTGDVGSIRAGDAIGWTLDVNPEAGSEDPPEVRSLRLGKVSGNTEVDVEGGIRSLRAVSWDGGSVHADWLGYLRTTGSRREQVSGDFSGDLSLDGNPDQRRRTLSSASIAGDLTGDWTISGDVSSIRAGDATGWSLDVNSEVRSLTLGQVSGDTQVDVEGPIRYLRAVSWDGGCIEADWIGYLRTTGARRPVEDNGDFGADITLSGNNAPRDRTLSSASIVGSLTGGAWNITTGNVGMVRASSFEPDWTLTAAVGEIRSLYSRGDFSSKVTAKSLTSLYVRQNLDGATITLTQPPEARTYAARSITVRGWIADSTLLFSGNVRSLRAGGMRDSALFAGVAGPGDGNGDGVFDLPDPATQLALGVGERCRIDSLRVTGIRGEEFTFINTNLAAAEFGYVYVRSSQDDNGGVPFGIAADTIDRALWNGERFRGLEEPKDSVTVLQREFRII